MALVSLGALRAACVVSASLFAAAASAQERFSIFVGSDMSNVARMVRLAELKDDDVVTDLGSGDGRIVIAAAKANPKLRGIGVDIDAKLVQEATTAAQTAGVGDRVHFVHQNAFDADLSQVSVIFMWLWPEVQQMLRPKILAEARPGTRVVTNVWDLGSWEPDAIDKDGPPVSMWVVPARLGGSWAWSLQVRDVTVDYAGLFEQHFQRAEGFARVGNRRGVFREVRLRGEDLTMRLDMTIPGGFARHEFTGKVRADTIEGRVRIALPDPNERTRELIVESPWRAVRAAVAHYLTYTGLDAP